MWILELVIFGSVAAQTFGYHYVWIFIGVNNAHKP
jgi:hypothetical protein